MPLRDLRGMEQWVFQYSNQVNPLADFLAQCGRQSSLNSIITLG
jgi:hypothetical protein